MYQNLVRISATSMVYHVRLEIFEWILIPMANLKTAHTNRFKRGGFRVGNLATKIKDLQRLTLVFSTPGKHNEQNSMETTTPLLLGFIWCPSGYQPKTWLKMNLKTWDHNDHRPSIYKVEAIDIINKTSAFITSHPSQSVQCFWESTTSFKFVRHYGLLKGCFGQDSFQICWLSIVPNYNKYTRVYHSIP